MPELPEVETVKRGLNQILSLPAKVSELQLRRKDLRRPFPKGLKAKVTGQKLLQIERRAKYLLFRFADGTLINHLGMTGTWREIKSESLRDHDHMVLDVGGHKLVYNDPRRFGSVDWVKDENSFFEQRKLGPEPLDREFDADYLFKALKARQSAVKIAIMNQEVVVGVGNIYACEALFFSGVSPNKRSSRLTRLQAERLVDEIKKVLERAIQSGGTTISDFRQAGGSAGYFQQELAVYGRKDEACRNCEKPIVAKVIGGRNSFYCRSCQKG